MGNLLKRNNTDFSVQTIELSVEKIYIVGIGPGSREYLLPKAEDILKKSSTVLAFKRALDTIKDLNANINEVRKLEDIIVFINSNCRCNSCIKEIAIAASGDPLFYGIGEYIQKKYSNRVEIIPGISSFQYMASKIAKPWNGANLGSLHGRQEDFINAVLKNKKSFYLTDSINSPQNICKKLYEKNIDCMVYIGENLSYEDEKITAGKPEELMNNDFTKLSVVYIEV